jgi:hypothetical protein
MSYFSTTVEFATRRKLVYVTICAEPTVFYLGDRKNYDEEKQTVRHDGQEYKLATGVIKGDPSPVRSHHHNEETDKFTIEWCEEVCTLNKFKRTIIEDYEPYHMLASLQAALMSEASEFEQIIKDLFDHPHLSSIRLAVAPDAAINRVHKRSATSLPDPNRKKTRQVRHSTFAQVHDASNMPLYTFARRP